jgi:hypothetical protein
MDDFNDQSAVSPGQEHPRPEKAIGRRRLLKMLTAAGGAALASMVLPDVWSQPTVEAKGLPDPPAPPFIFGPTIDDEGRAHFHYQDPNNEIAQNTTKMVVGTTLHLGGDVRTLSGWDAKVAGNGKNGLIMFRPPSQTCISGSTLAVQLRVPVANASDRASNILAWSVCNQA